LEKIYFSQLNNFHSTWLPPNKMMNGDFDDVADEKFHERESRAHILGDDGKIVISFFSFFRCFLSQMGMRKQGETHLPIFVV
jgi:hypothetical protein